MLCCAEFDQQGKQTTVSQFKDKRVARSVAEMLNAQPIGGKKGSRWRDDVWTMKYLPKFKWHMLTEQIGKPRSILRRPIIP